MHSQYSTDRTLIVYHYSRLCYYEAVEKDVSDHTGSVRKYRVFQEQPKNCLEMVPVLSPEIGVLERDGVRHPQAPWRHVKFSAGMGAVTEKQLAEKAGHLEMLRGGKKDGKDEKKKHGRK
ncbi:hypothetical protein M8818_006466 [Zalaria obscura]|uniref:Uncharacterized protein n=1 Tax=Zalaria obscura TaxID=2024903 RepID=A0ACC3SA90_9PEZI